MPLELTPGSVVHIANVWERGDGDLVGLDVGAISAPKSALGAFAVSAARARAGVLMGHTKETRRIVGPAAKGLLDWRTAVGAENNSAETVQAAPVTIALDEDDSPVEQIRFEATELVSSAAPLPLVLLEDCRPGVTAQLFADRVIDELLLTVYRGPEPPRAALAVGDDDRGEVLMTW